VGSQIVPGAPEAVRWLRDQELTVRLTTNTDSVTPAALADRLARRGFPASENELVAPVAVAAQQLASAPPARVLGKPSPEFFTAPAGGARPQPGHRTGRRRRPGGRHRGGRVVGAATVRARNGWTDRRLAGTPVGAFAPR
jgi:ribonucleotide monophosphatase NagD (HAD superfamily)